MRSYLSCQVTIDDLNYFSAYAVIGEDWNGFALPYFTLEQGKRICGYLNEIRRNQWVVMNLTDDIIASTLMSKVDAEKFLSDLNLKLTKQGYYLTAEGKRITPDNVKLEIRKAHDEPTESTYNETSDCFVIYEELDDDYEPVEYTGEDISVDGKVVHTYPIGAGSWIWSLATRLN